MPDELSYVLITPYSVRKSRTGGIISRLISRSGLELVAGRMFAPSQELVEEYAKGIVSDSDPRHRRTQELIRDYVLKNFGPNPRRRVLMLVLRGPDAVRKVLDVAGHIVNERTSGETIRDTYGDYLVDGDAVTYFEPAVLAPPTPDAAKADLLLWAKHSDSDGGILDDLIQYKPDANIEKTLVLIKPDNFRFPNARPGGVIDTFSQAGLSIIGFKVHHMSVAQAEQFYGPVLEVLQNIHKGISSQRSRPVIEMELGFPLSDEVEKQLGEVLGPVAGRNHWETLVQFMAGLKPSQCPPAQRETPGSEKCVALIYQGADAVRKIRGVLGPTDPAKAPHGSIRREFGQTMMINAAHASDSADNAEREMGIIQASENNLKPLIESHFNNA